YLVGHKRHSAAALAHVEIRTTPTGAAVKVDGESRGASNLSIGLPVGNHSVSVELAGYQTATASIDAKLGHPAAVDLALAPIMASLRLFSDVEGSQTSLDGKPLNSVQDGEYAVHSLAPGAHSVKFSSMKGQAAIGVDVEPGKTPSITSPVEATGVDVALVHQSAGHAWVFCNCTPAKVGLDDQPPYNLAPAGLDWHNLPAGAHQLKLQSGARVRTLSIQVTGAPVVSAYVFSKQQA